MSSSDTDNGGKLAAPAKDPAMTVQKGRAIGGNVLNVEETSGVPSWLSTKKKDTSDEETSFTGGVRAASRNVIVDLTSPEPSLRSPAAQLSAKKLAKLTPSETGLIATFAKNEWAHLATKRDPVSSSMISSPMIVEKKETPLAKKRKHSTHGAEKEQDRESSRQIGEKIPRTAEEGQKAIDCENNRDSLSKRPSRRVAAQRQSSYAESSIAVDDYPAPEGQKEAGGKGPETMNGQDTLSKRPSRRVAAQRQSSYVESSITVDDQPAPEGQKEAGGKGPETMNGQDTLSKRPSRRVAAQRQSSYVESSITVDDQPAPEGQKEAGGKGPETMNGQDTLSKRPTRRVAAQRQSSYAESSIAVDDQPAPEGQKEAGGKGPETMNGQDTWSKRPSRRVAAQRQSSYVESSITVDDQPAPEGQKEAGGKGPETMNGQDTLSKRPTRRVAAQRPSSYVESSITVDDQPAPEGQKEAGGKGPETMNDRDSLSKRPSRRVAAQRQSSYVESSITVDDQPAPEGQKEAGGKGPETMNDRDSLSKRPSRRVAAQRQSSYVESSSIAVDDQPAPEGQKEAGGKGPETMNGQDTLSKRPSRRVAAQRQSSYVESSSIAVDDQPAPEGQKEAGGKGPETMNGQDTLSKRPSRRVAAQRQSSYVESSSIAVDDQPAPEGQKEAGGKGPETMNGQDTLSKRPSRRVAAQRQSSYVESSSIAVDDQPAPEGQKEAGGKGPETMNGQDTLSKRPTRRVAAQRQSSYAEPSITEDDYPAPVRESGTVGKTKPAPFHVKKDPNEYYIEEEAHLYHNPPLPSDSTVGVLPCDLAPLPPPPPPPSPMPRTGNCNWSYDEANRVFTADFTNHGGPIDPIDEDFMLKVMERDDLTLISDGLLDPRGLEPDLWTIENIAGTYGDDFFHKFRRFDTVFDEKGGAIVLEKDSLYSMRMIDYWSYLQKREEVLDGVENDDSKFCFKDHLGKDHEIDVQKSALYCIDLDMKKSLTEIYDDFLRNFRMASILPGGKHCLMNKVTEDARPFMGPNLYITPPGTFTHFHQDGHGTVDSGHLALSGYNEICILRRLTERHKRHALWLLTGTKTEEKSARQTFFDGLYAEPHADGHGEKPAWPTRAQIEECRKMGYCPSLPILKKGQHIHINKGRLHAFRKMTLGNTHEEDCHREARMKVFATEQLVSEQLCVSVAWDWNFLGTTERGIYRELSSTLEAAILNRLRSVRSLAIPELSLLEAARHFAKPTLPTNLNVQLVPTAEKPPCQEDQYKTTVCRGILPVLRYVIKEHVAAIEAAGAYSTGEAENHPDTYADPSLSAIDPRGIDGFSCKTCSMELSNVYFHCDGCENLLSKDFNICLACHSGQNYKIFSQMHPFQQKRHAALNHVGNMKLERSKRCPCKNGPVCTYCSFCLGCSCKCHARFTLHCRLHTKETELKILGRVEAKADLALGRNPCKYLDDAALTEQRFAMAKRSWGHVDDINLYG